MNAIITAATGYTETDLQIFLWSIAKNCKNTTVFLIAYYKDRESIEQLREKYSFIQPVYIGASIRKQFARLANYRTSPYYYWLALYLSKRKYSSVIFPIEAIGRLALRIPQERFFIALQIMKAHKNIFSNILLTDSRDVVIQGDPFHSINGKLISGLEPSTVRNERFNASWIEAIYGKNTLDKMLDSSVVCSGVTLGSAQEIENYLDKMCEEMWRLLPKIIFKEGCDQGFHNYLIFEKELELELTSNQQGIIATLSLEDAAGLEIDYRQELVKIGNRYPAIIHQYDRHPKLVTFFTQLATKAPAELLS